MFRPTTWSLVGSLCLLAGCEAPENQELRICTAGSGPSGLLAASTSAPGVSTPEPQMSLTEVELAGLFALADNLVSGTLFIDEPDAGFDPGRVNTWIVRIDNNYAMVGGNGVAVPEDCFRLVASLSGQVVVAGLVEASGGWKSIIGDGHRLCIAREDQVKNLLSVRARLEADPLWHPDALVREVGDWEQFLSALPTQEGSWIDDEVREVRGANHTRAGDILGWYARTVGQKLEQLPSLRLHDANGSWEFDDPRLLAQFVMEGALGLRSGSIVRRNWRGEECCRRLWMLCKLVAIAGRQLGRTDDLQVPSKRG